MQNLSDRLVRYLELLRVEYVFGVPGGHSSALFEALDRSAVRGGPRTILTRHESGAASMADGYARETGTLGVISATTGPGATNTITGVASAFFDHVPLLVLTAQTPVSKFGRAAFQESSSDGMDTARMLAECTRYSSIITHVEQFEYKLAEALMVALRDDPGPVHLSIPVDLSRAPMPSAEPLFGHLPELLARSTSVIDTAAVDALTERLHTTLTDGGRVTVLVGHECRGATTDIMRFAESTGARVITTQRGKSWVDPFHPLARGVFGYAGHAAARAALQDAALILAVGTGLGQWSTSKWDPVLLNERLVHIHPMPRYFARSPMATLQVRGDAAGVFGRLRAGLEDRGCAAPVPMAAVKPVAGRPSHIEVRNAAGYDRPAKRGVSPQQVLGALMDGFLPDDTRVVVDVTNWLPWSLHFYFPRAVDRYRHSSELCAMGWGIGACVGTALGDRTAPVLCLVGDGGLLMNGQEITVAVTEKLPIVYMVLNDGAYGMVRHRHAQIADKPLPFEFDRVDFAAMAQALGARGQRIRSIDDLLALDPAELFGGDGPVVLDLLVDPDLGPAMGMY